METITRTHFRLWHLVALMAIAITQLHAQKTGATESEETKLLIESDRLLTQAEDLRTQSETSKGETKKMMLEEAANMEQEAMRLKFTAITTKYQAARKKAVNNEVRLQKLKQQLAAGKQKTHSQFLAQDCQKNLKIADDLYRESTLQGPLAARLGSIENAYDRISTALQLQDDIFLMIREEQAAQGTASAH